MMQTIPHQIVRTNNKHSRAMYKNGVVEIRLAKRLTKKEEAKHVTELLKKMVNVRKRHTVRMQLEPFKDVFTCGQYTVATQQEIVIQIQIIEGRKLKVQNLEPYTWHITRSNTTSKKQIESLLWKQLSQDAIEFFTTEIACINKDTFAIPIKGIRLRHAKSVWGSCSHTNTIMLNTGLLFVPPHLLTYVIIHELAHCLEANHSKKYWQHVALYCETYKQDRKELRGYTLR